MTKTTVRERLAKYWPLLWAKKVVLDPLLTRGGWVKEAKLIESFPSFVPYSSGSSHALMALTVAAVNQTFPLMVDLLSLSSGPMEAPVSMESFIDSDAKRDAAAKLQSLFDQYGSDKSTVHDYHLLYGAILAEPEVVTDLLEVGLGTNNIDVVSNMGIEGRPGASLRAFRDFLPKARIYGADIDRRVLFEDERIKTFFVDQTAPHSFEVLSGAVPDQFDLIIDDGLHAPNANIATLLFALGRLKIGGWFVVEDIGPDALPIWRIVSALLPSHFEDHLIAGKGAFLVAVRRAS